MRIIQLPLGSESRWFNSVVDEQDCAIFGEEVLWLIGGVMPQEHGGIAAAMHASFRKARANHEVFPSPVLATYLGLQEPTGFDTVVIEPPTRQPRFGIVFLHGFMGNSTIQCMQIASAVDQLGGVTICPSTGGNGYWWQPRGHATIRSTLSYLRNRGIHRIYLGGFSNGGAGVGDFASRAGGEDGLAGLFFIAGAGNGKSVRGSRLPVLVIQGLYDERMPVEAARRFAEEVGPRAVYVELKADHFLIMKQSELVQNALRSWVQQIDENSAQVFADF